MAATKTFNKSFRLIQTGSTCQRCSSSISNPEITPRSPNQLEALLNTIKPIQNLANQRAEAKGHQAAQHILRQEGHRSTRNKSIADEIRESTEHSQAEKRMFRRWKEGDVYAPHDLHPVEQQKFRMKPKPTKDVFDHLGINPMDEYKNFAMMSEFMTTIGRIKHPRETGLRPVNQRRVARAIRRIIGMGFMPSVHKHPEMLRRPKLRPGS